MGPGPGDEDCGHSLLVASVFSGKRGTKKSAEVRTGTFSELREGEGMEYHISPVLRSTFPPHLTISKIGMGLTFHGMLQYNWQ